MLCAENKGSDREKTDAPEQLKLVALRPQTRRLHAIVFAFWVLAICLPMAPGLAATLAWPDKAYDYIIVDQDIHEVLQNFGKNLDVKVQIDESIKGRIRGSWPKQQPRAFLETLAQRFGFDWYFDGHVLHLSATTKAQTILLFLGPVPFKQLRQELAELDILEPRFPLRSSSSSNLALVAGPPRYVEMVTDTLAALNSRIRAETKVPAKISVFRGPGRGGS